MTFEYADPTPEVLTGTHRCQGWHCHNLAVWRRWGGKYCYDHAIRAGWLPGPLIYPGTQLELRA